MQNVWTVFFGQLLTQMPLLLVYVVGIVLAAAWARRAPLAAMLTLVGLGIMLVATVGQMFMQNYLITGRNRTAMSIGQMFQWLSLGSSILRAIGLGMVVGGVFANRPPPEPRGGGFDIQSGPPPMPR